MKTLLQAHNAFIDDDLDEEEYNKQLKKLKALIRPLIPVLHNVLKERYQKNLDLWVQNGNFSGIEVQSESEIEIPSYALDFTELTLNIPGGEGWYLDEDEIDDVLNLEAFRASLSEYTNKALKDISEEKKKQLVRNMISKILQKKVEDNDRFDLAFSIYSIMENDNVPLPVRTLWMLNADVIFWPDEDDIWELLDGEPLALSRVWSEIQDQLPAEINELLQHQHPEDF